MNRKVGQLIKAALFALPFALPGVALAQSATGSTGSASDTATQPAPDTSNKGTLDQDKTLGNQNTQGSSGVSSGSSGTVDQNAGSLGNSTNPSEQPSGMGTGSQQGTTGTGSDYTPPAGSLDKSGSSSTSDRNLGGDINKTDESQMNTESTGTTPKKTKKTKKTSKRSTTTESTSDTSSGDMNK